MLTQPERAELQAALSDPRRRLGPYVLIRELGRGGMGVVYKAYDPRVDRLVAIKRMLDSGSDVRRTRFHREARLTGQLGHPGIPAIHEVVSEGPGAPYMVLEFVRGTPLDVLWADARPSREELARVVAEVAEALVCAHTAGVLHRDLKPANVMRAEDGRTVVLDFGLAKRVDSLSEDVTRTGTMLGTPAYMPPEQIGGAKQAGAAADLYAVGGVLYYGLTGEPPFSGPMMPMLAAIKAMPPEPPRELEPDADPDLERICLRCLQKEPAQRYPDAQTLADELRRVEAGGSVARAGGGPPLALVAAGAALLLLGGIGIAVTPGEPTATSAATEEEVEVATPPAPPAEDEPTPATSEPTESAEQRRDRALHKVALARARAKQGQFAQAFAELDEGEAADPTCDDVWAERGYVHYLQKDYSGAVAAYTEAIRLDPRGAMNRVNRGLNQMYLERFQLAEDDFTEAIRLQPKHPGHREDRARCRLKRGDLDGARRDALRATELDPARDEARELLRRIESQSAPAELPPSEDLTAQEWKDRARAAARRGAYGEAVRAFDQAVLKDPQDRLARWGRSRALIKLGRHRDAIQDLEKILAERPDRVRCWGELGFCKFRLKDHAGAIEAYERALELEPNNATFLKNLASNRNGLGDLEGAVAAYERALKIEPDRWTTHAELAECLAKLGKLREAHQRVRRALELNPDHPPLVENLRWINQKLRERGETPPDPISAKGWYRRAVGMGNRKRYAESIAACDRALALDPKHDGAWTLRGWCQYQLGAHAEAVRSYGEAIALKPKLTTLWINRASNYQQLGKEREAISDLDRALKLDPQRALAWIIRGRSYGRLSEWGPAARDMREGVRLDPDNESARRDLEAFEARLSED